MKTKRSRKYGVIYVGTQSISVEKWLPGLVKDIVKSMQSEILNHLLAWIKEDYSTGTIYLFDDDTRRVPRLQVMIGSLDFFIDFAGEGSLLLQYSDLPGTTFSYLDEFYRHLQSHIDSDI